MPPTIHALLPEDALRAAPSCEHRRFRVATQRLRMGMFVAELDRPWLDTPFLIQGFLADSDIELKTLQRYCRYVYVDLDRSAPELAGVIRAARDFDVGEFADDPEDPPPRKPERAVAQAAPSTPPLVIPAFLARRDPPAQAVAPDGRPPANGHDTGPYASGPDAWPLSNGPDTRPLSNGPDTRPLSNGPDTRPLSNGPDTRPLSNGPDTQTQRAGRQPAAARAYRVRADVRISRETRDRFRSFVKGDPAAGVADANEVAESLGQRAMSRLRGLFGQPRGNTPRAADPADGPHGDLLAEIAAALPRGSAPTLYTDRHEAAIELPRARRAFAKGDEALSLVAGDVRAARPPRLEPVDEAVDQMIGSLINNPDALLWVAQMREESQPASQQGVRVALYLILLGRQLGLPRAMLSTLGTIGMLADVGKVRLPRALLDKPGMLNPAEYSIVKEHVRLGLEALSCSAALTPEVERGIAQHHERMDGSGYPKGLRGHEIGLYGRMAGIADSFAALSAPRAYANPLAAQDALMSLYQWADSSFHGSLVEQFVQAIGVFPVGSMVELSGGEVAVVVAHNRVRRLEPRVLLLTAPDKRPLPFPLEIDLMQPPRQPAGKPLRVIRGLPSGAYGLKLRDYYADGCVASAG